MNEQIKILGIKINDISYSQTIAKIDRFIASKEPHQIITVNPEIIMHAQKDNNYKQILNNSNINVADGSGIIWASKYKKQNIKHKVTGIDLIYKIAEISEKKKYKIFLLGGKNRVAYYSAEKLHQQYPKLHIVGFFEGFPIIKDNLTQKENLENLKIVNQIIKTRPDILLVAYGAPKQEKFIYKYKEKLNIPVMIGVGGSFDFISGKIKRAPKWIQDLHLEWLYRVVQQPSRISRIFNATILFPLRVIFQKK